MASLIVRSKITGFALFYIVFEVNFPRTSPRGTYIWSGDLTEGFFFCITGFGGLIFGGAYTWRGIDFVSRRLLKWISRIENGLKLRPTRYRTHGNKISTRLIQIIKRDEEGDFEVVYGRTCMTRLERSVRDHDLCVCIPRLLSY